MITCFLHRRTALRRWACCTAAFLLLLAVASPVRAARVVIVGDLHYALVADVAAGIQLSLTTSAAPYATEEVKGRLGGIVLREDARVVVALGQEAVAEALRLPPDIDVVYGLIAVPPESDRKNLTGVYMSPPVKEYVSIVRRYLPAIATISVVGNLTAMKRLLGGDRARTAAYHVDSPSRLVETVNRLSDHTALLLLPDASLLTTQVLANAYLFSFRNNIPLLGISEANVKQGALFALVFDPRTMSRQLGEKVQAIQDGYAAKDIPASPPERYDLYINSTTAHKMGIEIPDEMLRKSKEVYQ